jgi:electron-transferring-flavoprotein dehydrogenase
MSEEAMQYDVVVVGAGPSGLSAAIRLKQLDPTVTICILEKGSEVGSHILSGCVLETKALQELIPDWREKGAPIHCEVRQDRFSYLTVSGKWRLPTPPQMKNHGNYIISLANLCRWLAAQAQEMGVEIYPGFAGASFLKNEKGHIIGIKTGDMGLDKEGQPTDLYQPGMNILAKQVLIGEGCRGSLAEQVMNDYQLREGIQPQTYGIGLKEIWQISPEKHQEGLVEHTIGWPLDQATYGGSFLYHMENHQVAVGFVIGLDYQNPYLSPFEEFQRFKTHPKIRSLFEGGTRIAYGARALNEGGWQSLPKLIFPGGALIGCSAGFLNVPKIKGTHLAMKSGMLAAEGIYEFLQGRPNDYPDRLEQSWVAQELKVVRNIRPGFKWGLVVGLVNAAVETYVTRGKAPWTLAHHQDHTRLKTIDKVRPIPYPKPDQKLTFDRLSSVFLCNTHHPENQPNHLILRQPSLAIEHNYKLYNSPEQRYCPAHVYEIVEANQGAYLQINSANCIHCKTCDIKDPLQNIQWVPPEGGSGPNYGNM